MGGFLLAPPGYNKPGAGNPELHEFNDPGI
jgi:hypothetical protein